MERAKSIAAPVLVSLDRRADGTIILENGLPLPSVEGTIPGRLKKWSATTPDALFLTQDDRALTYGNAEQRRRMLAERLLDIIVDDRRPLMIVADNGIDHALLMLAATSVNLPVAIVSTSYVAEGAKPWAKFCRVVAQVDPQLIVADKCEVVRQALAGVLIDVDIRPLRDLGWLEKRAPAQSALVDAAERSVTVDSVAKLLFTSGSTGNPKAVPNTQAMMVSNMLGLATIWPFLAARPPVSVDWLPWNHTFGGNCCFNSTLWFGGHSHIDGGRPTPASIGRSIEAIRRWKPNLYYNVPIGFEILLPTLESDSGFAHTFFNELDFIFNAGAPIPAALRQRLDQVAEKATGRLPYFVGGWGSTETAPFSTALFSNQRHANNLGVPIPGTQIKLVPDEDRYELRVKGPNVMPGYWRDPQATAAAFDEEGFYKIGDAAKFADPADPGAGLLFDGRVAENFKLISGTWVNVASLRLSVISATEKLVSDAVVAGEGRNDISLLLFPNEDACRALLPPDAHSDQRPSSHPAIHDRLIALIRGYNANQIGSSTRIARFILLEEPPSSAHDEITDKGYINQRKVLSRRAAIVEALYADNSTL